MIFSIEHPIALMAIFIWIGFVGAISFMESWVKFKAPNVDLSVGLGIGRLVFKSLNYVEWGLALIIITSFFLSSASLFSLIYIPFFVALVVVAIQSIWMLPALDRRATKVISGEKLNKSFLHFYYVGGEFIKITSLVYFGIILLKT